MSQLVLISNNYLSVPDARDVNEVPASLAEVGTVLSNMAYYGYAPSFAALAAIQQLSQTTLAHFWTSVEPTFSQLSAADREMSLFVVYKNFPAEVLSLKQGEYWTAQILMYLGAPASLLTQPEAQRPALVQPGSASPTLHPSLTLKKLELAEPTTLDSLYQMLREKSVRWTPTQRTHIGFIHYALGLPPANIEHFRFKENGIALLVDTWSATHHPVLKNATDVLRLAAGLSGGDLSLRDVVVFRSFKRWERKLLLSILEKAPNLNEDFAARAQAWKKLLSKLHPGDYAFVRVSTAYDALYNNKLTSFHQTVEQALSIGDISVLDTLATRPGEFVRRLHQLYALFGESVVQKFRPVTRKLSAIQLLKLQSYLRTINSRQTLMYPPNGNWSRVQIAANNKVIIPLGVLTILLRDIGESLLALIPPLYPEGVALPPEARNIKLQTNDQELAPYGRGTVFAIPEDVRFIRTASYWEQPGQTVWFDNGWNFFNSKWEALSSMCWNAPGLLAEKDGQLIHAEGAQNVAAVFSGDPVNSDELHGRACQLIDLYLEPLQKAGVRYAVWNILSYSRVPFDSVPEVLATLQWGENPEVGALYEPARAQMVFPLKGKNLTKYVAMIDVQARKLVYLDANFPGDVSSAISNSERLSLLMPAYLEYLRALPTVTDYFASVAVGPQVITKEACFTGVGLNLGATSPAT
ncbi:MAG: hypothetical protein Q7S87_03415 [Agitococcus sp.]|nr:hypothetical protein [Agitococcus sp.]MDO9178686.1 hypothetical protein [Agitococcus sp.]